MAQADPRVTAGAVVGSLALADGDRWSDLDLTFAVVDDVPIQVVLAEWTASLVAEFGAVHLFDLPSGGALYRVFLLPGCLQFDLSFAPAAQFGAAGPKFRLLFGRAVEKPHFQPPPPAQIFGYAVHHALRARFCIERGRLWQSEYWISSLRDEALSLACQRRGLTTAHGRGYDDLPAEVLEKFNGALVANLERQTLLAALRSALAGLLSESAAVQALADQVAPELHKLTVEWES